MKRRIAIAILALLALAGCAREPKVEQIDGVDCMVKRNFAGKVTALDCNWDGDAG